MSVLAGLFGLGFFAIAFPFLFHLIRRTPKGQVAFSSLMFLRPSPPRLTRRSRLENWLLLALRMAAIALIAAAFMRPFFRDNIELSLADLPGRKIAVVLDTSASMRRGDLWQQALRKCEQIVNRATENDDVAIYTFDSRLVLRKPPGLKTGDGNFLRRCKLDDVQPGWHGSDLGKALVSVADELDRSSDQEKSDGRLQIVVISDLQSGCSISALQNYQWPEDVKVDLQQVTVRDPSNASLQLMPADESDPESQREIVLVRNLPDSAVDQFTVCWSNDDLHAADFYVPPGSTRILRVPRQSESLKSDKLILKGDSADFDNQFFVVPPIQQHVHIAYLGNELAGDPEQMLYYFERCFVDTPTRSVEIARHAADQSFIGEGSRRPELVVVTRALSSAEQDAIDSYLNSGGTLLVVLSETEAVKSTAAWTELTGDQEYSAQSDNKYAMLGEVDFGDPVFQPFAGPRFNDFTQIRFWRHLQTRVSDAARVLASFDNGWPAMWHKQSLDSGSDVYVLATGWQPSCSQLALSSKFLPLINRLLELATRSPSAADSCVIGKPVDIPAEYKRVEYGNQAFDLDPDQPIHEQIHEPGIYRFISIDDAAEGEIAVAFNIDPAESNTGVMSPEQITAFDVRVGGLSDASSEIQRQRQLHDVELESKQKLWKWLIVAALSCIIFESWLAGRTDRAMTTNKTVLMEHPV